MFLGTLSRCGLPVGLLLPVLLLLPPPPLLLVLLPLFPSVAVGIDVVGFLWWGLFLLSWPLPPLAGSFGFLGWFPDERGFPRPLPLPLEGSILKTNSETKNGMDLPRASQVLNLDRVRKRKNFQDCIEVTSVSSTQVMLKFLLHLHSLALTYFFFIS